MSESQKDAPGPLDLIGEVEKRLSDYFKLFLKTHPLNTYSRRTPGKLAEFDELDYSEICRLGIPLQASVCALGRPVLERFLTLGLDVLVPADNPVDWFEWIVRTKDENIPFTVQASITLRIDAELGRMRYLAERGLFAKYLELDADTFLVSKARYQRNPTTIAGTPSDPPSPPPVEPQGAMLKAERQETRAWETLGKLEKLASLGGNLATVLGMFHR